MLSYYIAKKIVLRNQWINIKFAMATSVGGKLLAGNSNSVKVSNENGEPVAKVEEKEDEWEDSLAHRLNLNNN